MTRETFIYADAEVRAVHVAGAVDVTEPVAGFYRIKLGMDTVRRAVRLFHGPPNDPITGEVLDRSWRWQAILDTGEMIDFDTAWPKCAGDPITEREFQTYEARQRWAEENAPNSAYAKRGRRIDRLSPDEPLPF